MSYCSTGRNSTENSWKKFKFSTKLRSHSSIISAAFFSSKTKNCMPILIVLWELLKIIMKNPYPKSCSGEALFLLRKRLQLSSISFAHCLNFTNETLFWLSSILSLSSTKMVCSKSVIFHPCAKSAMGLIPNSICTKATVTKIWLPLNSKSVLKWSTLKAKFGPLESSFITWSTTVFRIKKGESESSRKPDPIILLSRPELVQPQKTLSALWESFLKSIQMNAFRGKNLSTIHFLKVNKISVQLKWCPSLTSELVL